MRFAKVRFESDEATAEAMLGLGKRMKITVLRDESFIVPVAGIDWLKSEGIPYDLIEWVNQDNVIEALRDNLAHSV